MSRTGLYSEDEWIVLLYYFLNRPEPAQTDSHQALQDFALVLGRTPGSVDASMRNIKAYVSGPGFPHGSSVMRSVVDQYRGQSAQLRHAAQAALHRINPGASLP